MFKKILNFFKLDLTLSLRDSVMVYSLISPILLAVIMRLVIPSVEGATLTVAVQDSVDPVVIERLESYAKVDVCNNRQQVIERVNRNDDVPGLYFEAGEYHLILEGNEDTELGAGLTAIMNDATGDPGSVTFAVEDLKGKPAPVLEYVAVMMVMLGLLIGGIIAGFNIVDEKETGVIRALAVSPLRMFEYICARSILALFIGCISGFVTAVIILGWDINLAGLVLAILISLLVALPFGFIIGAFADNQMTAFAMIKLLMAVFLTLPLVSIFVPAAWQWLFYIFPNYWMFTTIRNVLVGTGYVGFGLSTLLTVITGLLLIGLLFPKLKKGLRLR